jgi:hypothetical protein
MVWAALFAALLVWFLFEAWEWRERKRLAFPGLRLRLEYYDHNEGFGKLLPRLGTIDRQVTARGGPFWVLFCLDEPIFYKGSTYGYLLLRSRWQGHEIGGPAPTSVFILLVPQVAEVQAGFRIRKSEHVAWGMVHMIPGMA